MRLVSETVRPGDTVWVIGANMGLFSFAAAVAAGPQGRILTVEPDTTLVQLLRRSAAAETHHATVEVLPTAVAQDCDVARFCIARRNRATSHLAGFGSTQTGGIRSTQLVPTVSLNWLLNRFPAPDVLKIDVEGAEIEVLRGGMEVLLAHHPRLICEVSQQHATEVGAMLVEAGYTLFDGDQPPGERLPLQEAPFNTLALSTASASPQP